MRIRLYALTHTDHWSLSLITAAPPRGFELSNVTLVGIYTNEEHARSAIGALGLLLMETATRNPTFDTRDIVISAIDTFKRQRAA